MTNPPTISYLRTGRHLRASGTIIEPAAAGNNWMTKVKPCRREWGCVRLSGAEIDAGRDKPEYHPRPFDPNAEKKPRKARVPKAPAVPRWKQLIADARFYLERKAIFPDPNAAMIQGLADELEGARAELSQFLPLKP